jgi:hypothetical protein
MPAGLVALALGSFGIGLTEFVIAGLGYTAPLFVGAVIVAIGLVTMVVAVLGPELPPATA